MQIRRVLAQALADRGTLNTVTARLHWRTVTGRGEGYDVNDEGDASAGEVAAGSKEFRAFFHRVDHRLTGFQRFIEVQTGDVILDYLEDLELAGKEDVRVEVNGKFYVQKSASTELMESWDAEMERGGTMRSILLTPAA